MMELWLVYGIHQKSFGDFNHYDRKNDRWYDDAVRDNFKKISQGKFIKPSDFFVFTNTETVRTPNIENHMRITIGVKKSFNCDI